MIKAIFFDIDGTLVSFKTHKIPSSTLEALDKLRQKGIKLFVATGRHKMTINNLGDWRPDGYVTLNGAMCYLDGEIVFKRAIPESDVKALAQYLSVKGDVPCVYVNENRMVINFNADIADNIFRQLKFEPIPEGSLEESAMNPVYEVLIFIREEREREIMSMMPGSETARWHEEFTDVVAAGVNKWEGIEQVISRLGISREETMAFGDGGNDMHMIAGVGMGVAMGNAGEALKQIAGYVTDDIDDDGIMKAVKHFGLI